VLRLTDLALDDDPDEALAAWPGAAWPGKARQARHSKAPRSQSRACLVT
jgi:hypothetical protein